MENKLSKEINSIKKDAIARIEASINAEIESISNKLSIDKDCILINSKVDEIYLTRRTTITIIL